MNVLEINTYMACMMLLSAIPNLRKQKKSLHSVPCLKLHAQLFSHQFIILSPIRLFSINLVFTNMKHLFGFRMAHYQIGKNRDRKKEKCHLYAHEQGMEATLTPVISLMSGRLLRLFHSCQVGYSGYFTPSINHCLGSMQPLSA